MRARGAPNRHFNVTALENGKFIPGVGKINSVRASRSREKATCRATKKRPEKDLSPVPPAGKVDRAGPRPDAKNTVYFSSPNHSLCAPPQH